MSDIGYYQQIEGGINGNPDGPDLAAQVARQEATAAQGAALASTPGSVPRCYTHQAQGVLPRIGWTAQSGKNETVFPPYTFVGTTPDWTGDPNGIGAGQYDMNPVVGSMAPNPLGRAPIGDGLLQFDDRPNPNTLPQDVGGSIDDLEY